MSKSKKKSTELKQVLDNRPLVDKMSDHMGSKSFSERPENQHSVNQPFQHLNNRFQIQFDFDYKGTTNKKTGKSQTVPDLNLTVRQLLTNHSRGLSNDRHEKKPLYFDTIIPQIKDMTDVEEYRETLQHQINEVNNFINEEKNKQTDIPEENYKKPGEQLDLEDEAKNNPAD